MREFSAKRILIFSPGSQPEMAEAAKALISSNFKFKFLTAGILSDDGIKWRSATRLLPFNIVSKVGIRVQNIPAKHIANHGVLLDIAVSVSSERFRAPLIRLRNFWCALFCIVYLIVYRPNLLLSQSHSNSLPLLVAKRLHIKSVLNVSIAHHDWMLKEFAHEKLVNPMWAKHLQHDKVGFYDGWHLRQEIRNSDYFLASSSFTIKTFQEQGISGEKFLLVPLGFDPSRFHSKAENGLRSGFIFVGQLTQRKGISYLLESFKAISKVSSATLQIVGRDTGDFRTILQAQPGLRIHSHMSQSEVANLMQQARVFVLPSLAEGFCLSAIEAMASGLVVILSNRTGVHDIVQNGKNGFIVDPRDTEKIAELMLTLDSNPTLASQISIQASLTASEYTWEKYRHSVLEHLKRL